MIDIKATPRFMRLAKKAMTPEDTGGIRKIRWVTGKGGGKRGGLRVLYYFDGEYIVLLVTLFKKSDQENIAPSEKAEMRKLINELLGD